MDPLEKALQMLIRHPLCDDCLGRQFALLGYGLENEDRGRAIKLLLTLKAHQLTLVKDKTGLALLRTVAANGFFDMARTILNRLSKRAKKRKTCYLCEGTFQKTGMLADEAARQMCSYEFATFLVGVELPFFAAEREDVFKALFNVSHSESMKSQFSRDIGKKLAKATKKEVNYLTPDIVVHVNPFTCSFKLQRNPVYVAGRYLKLVRGIPQSRWLCRECNGKGCESCSWTGKTYPTSVEEFIGHPTLKMFDGEDTAFHGAGREDVDVRMLGSGRPFVLEVKEPRKRFIDLQELEQKINEGAKGNIEVRSLSFADKNIVREIKKKESSQKTYRVIAGFERDVSDVDLRKVERILSSSVIRQQTPRRVMHRRADLTREKYIYTAKIKRLSQNQVEMHIRCQGGLYIKELVTGDEGRTEPSVASILGVKPLNLQLDVLNVAWR